MSDYCDLRVLADVEIITFFIMPETKLAKLEISR